MQALPKETFKNWNMKYSENKTKFNSSKKSNSNFVFPLKGKMVHIYASLQNASLVTFSLIKIDEYH
jgi:hypothetical protein